MLSRTAGLVNANWAEKSPDSRSLRPSVRRIAQFALLALLAARLPSLVQPAGGDQGLYAYEGQRLLAGDVLYVDVWDQKPPGISFLYAAFGAAWPRESMVAGADLAAAAMVAFMLTIIGRRRYSEGIGYAAAGLFLLLGDPYLQRLSGIYVRGQCEPFIALAVTSSVALLSASDRRAGQFLLAGVAFGLAFWLKYNALLYALPVAYAVWGWRTHDRSGGTAVSAAKWVGLGFLAVAAFFLSYVVLTGAITDFWLATIKYNLNYSEETYAGPVAAFGYLLRLPFERARVDMLWFVGGLGSALLLLKARRTRGALVAPIWLVAAVGSIALNGQRDLPNYFVQAQPALALAAAAGLSTARNFPLSVRLGLIVVLAAGLWRVGADRPVAGARWAGLPGVLQNVRYDLAYGLGRMDRATYLDRFKGAKHDALEVDRLAELFRTTTNAGDPVFVFGFSGGSVCWKSGRASASRFFWSRPVTIEFAADRPGYGSLGLLADLERRRPVVVALQKEQWQSETYFMMQAPLRAWLVASYTLESDTRMFTVWRRKP